MKIASLKPTEWFPGQKISVKPHLRGWIHLVAAPLSLAASIVLTCLAPSGATKWGSAIYLAASLILFGISALYHRFYWSPRWEIVWNRLDHSNIFLLIAGTYTPLSVAVLPHDQAVTILSIVWGGALAGILLNLFQGGSQRSFTLLWGGLLCGTSPNSGRSRDRLWSGFSWLAESCTRSARLSTQRRNPIYHLAGSGSTRSFIPSRFLPGHATAPPCI